MKVRFTFEIEAPIDTEVQTVREAGRRAVCAAENTIEDATGLGAQGGTCRVTVKANERHSKP